MTISEKEKALDAAAEKAARDLHEFREKHHRYFWFVGHTDLDGKPVVERQPHIDREATRLHQVAIAANKAAADAEYYANLKRKRNGQP